MEKIQKARLCTLSSLPSVGASLIFFQRIFARIPHAGYFVVLVYLMYGFRDYLSKTSKYYYDDVPLRPWNHYLIWTSGIYLAGAIVAFLYDQTHFSVLCFITWIGSSIYHRHKEAKFFNIDNIFATSLLVIFVWSMCISYTFSSFYFYFGVLGIPVAGFLLVYCGMPADIVSVYRGTMCCYIREDRPIYMVVHACWHVASGTGPLAVVWLFHNYGLYNGDLTYIMGVSPTICFDPWKWLPVVPTMAVLIGVIINACGNWVGIMPLD